MTDEDIKDLVILHDKSIDKMAMGIEHLASAVSSTNRKLEDIIDVIAKQNILMEKFSNLESNMKEQFTIVYTKIRDLESAHNGQGCSAMKVATKVDEDMLKRLASLESSLTWIVRLIISGLISGALGTLAMLAKGN